MPERRPARDVTKARLLKTAEAMFLDRGYAATSVDAIAAEAGFTTGAIYSNFGGKADLFLAVVEHAAAADFEAIRRALEAATTDEQRLDVFNTATAADGARLRSRIAATLEFLAVVRHDPALQARVLAAQELADEVLGELVAALCRSLGVEQPVTTKELAVDVNALLNGLAIRSLFDPDLEVTRVFTSGIVRLLTSGRSELTEASSHAR
jgi:AcrR family transcriptional regulator